MPLNKQQAKFVKDHVLATLKWDADRKAEREAELAALSGKVADAVAAGAHPSREDIVRNLEETLKDTGRIEDPDAPDDRAELKEEHLRDIILRDEDGLNANQIVDAMVSPPSKAIRDFAMKRVTPDTPPKERAGIEAAKARMAEYEAQKKAAHETVARDLTAMTGAQLALGRTSREARNAAMHQLAEREGQHSLSHHGSRHGAHTTDEEQIRRVATGFAPDNVPPAGTPTMNVRTRDNERVSVPDTQTQGPNPSNKASRFASAEIALHLIEGLIADVQQARIQGDLDESSAIKREVAVPASAPIIGDQAVPARVGSSYKTVARPDGSGGMTTAGETLPSSRHLDNAARSTEDKQDIVRDRAASAGIERNVRGATLIMRGLPDGSFRMVTAYPNEDVTSSSTRDETRDMAVSSDPGLAKVKAKSAADAALDEANADRAAKEVAARDAETDRQAKHGVAEQALIAGHAALPPAADDGKRDALLALQRATQAWRTAQISVEALDQQRSDIEDARKALGREIKGRGRHVAALTNARDAKQLAQAADPTNGTLNYELRAAQEALDDAQETLDFINRTSNALDTQIVEYRRAHADAASDVERLNHPMTQAYETAVAVAGKAESDQIKALAENTAQAMNDYVAAQLTVDQAKLAVEEAKRVQSLAEEAVAQKSDAPPPTAEERLRDALAQGEGDMAEARTAWEKDIAELEVLLEADQMERAREIAEMDAQRDIARDTQEEARKEAKAADDALDKLKAQGADSATPGYDEAVSRAERSAARKETAESDFRRIREQVQDFKKHFRNQEILDAANIELARAKLAATAETLLLEKATAEGTADVAMQARAAKAQAEEDRCAKTVIYRDAVDARRLASSGLKAVEAELEEATAKLDRLLAEGLGTGDGPVKAQVEKVDAITELRDKQEVALEKAGDACKEAQRQMTEAEKRARALA